MFIDFTYYLAITSIHVVITFDVITNKTNINEIIEHELQNKKIQEKDFQRIIKSLIANEIKTIDNITYPIKKGDKLGTLYIKDSNGIIAKSTIISDSNINKKGFISLFFTNLKNILTGN